MFTYQTQLHLHESDAAGVMFFSQQFKLMHDAYESLLDRLGIGFPRMLTREDYFLPIVHAQSDYLRPVVVGDVLTILVKVAAIGETSFTLDYEILNQDKQAVGKGKTVHVTVDKTGKTKVPLPDDFRQVLESYRDSGSFNRTSSEDAPS